MKAFSQALRTMRRSPYQSLTAVVVVLTTFLLIFLVSSAMQVGESALKYFEAQPAITIFLKAEVSDAQAATVAATLEKWPGVSNLTLIDKASAFKMYGEANADEPLLIELLNADLFPVSLTLTANSAADLEMLQSKLLSISEVDEVVFNDDVYQEFLSWTRLIRLVGLGLCAIFVVQLVLVLTVIMSMVVASKRESISIMKIIGATRGMVKSPFVIEGMWFGFWGSLVAWGIATGALFYFTPMIQKFFGDIKVLPLTTEFLIYQGAIGIGAAVILGALSASIAADRMVRKRR
jgi:cell division transport system permease protein